MIIGQLQQIPQIGQTRRVEKFLWFPRILPDRSVRWLETVEIVQVYEDVTLFSIFRGRKIQYSTWVTVQVTPRV